jgi:hypothetical protein
MEGAACRAERPFNTRSRSSGANEMMDRGTRVTDPPVASWGRAWSEGPATAQLMFPGAQ